MAYTRYLPDYSELLQLREVNNLSDRDIASKYGVHHKSVWRAFKRGEELTGQPRKPLRSGAESPDDWVKKDLIYGEIIDFMGGYEKTPSQAARSLQLQYEIVHMILDPSVTKIQRSVAHKVVKAVMKYERHNGEPPDLYPIYSEEST